MYKYILKYLTGTSRDFRNCFIFLLIFFLLFFNFGFLTQTRHALIKMPVCTSDLVLHYSTIENYYGKRKHWKTSNLGSIMFKNIDSEVFIHTSRTNKTFVVLIWKYWEWLKKRHIYNFNSSRRPLDILDGCSVQNCRFSGYNNDLSTADAVVIHMQRGEIPSQRNRNQNQRWIFLNDESPMNKFSLSKTVVNLQQFANIFNWTMTFRSDADIPVPYGRTVPLPSPVSIDLDDAEMTLSRLVPYWNDKQFAVQAMVLISNCSVKKRMRFLAALRNLTSVDIYGACADVKENENRCPGHFRSDCKLANEYLFYLVLENSSCKQYLTEKSFYHALSKGAIPVIMGTPLKDCEDLLPPNSFIHVDQFENIEDLARHIEDTASSYDKILSYHLWRKHFGIANEHGYFGSRSYHYCRVCEALNYNDGETKTYGFKELKEFFDSKTSCDLTPEVRNVTKTVTQKTSTTREVMKMKANSTAAANKEDDIKYRSMRMLV